MEFFSEDAEKYVLSGMRGEELLLCIGIESLNMEDFYLPGNQTIFCCLKEMYKENTLPGLEKLVIKLKEIGELDRLGGIKSVTDTVCNYICGIDDFNYYINIVKSRSIIRQIKLVNKLISTRLDSSDSISGFDFLLECKSMYEKIIDYQGDLSAKSFKEESLAVTIPYLINKRDGKITEEIVPTGFASLDAMITGLGGGQVWTICARTGIGKTTFALNMAANIMMSGKNVYFFSLEMSYREISERLLAQLSDIPQENIKSAKLTDSNLSTITEIVNKLSNSSIIINEKGGLKVSDICSIARRAKEHYSLSAIFVDYLQLIEGNTPTEFRHLEIAQVTRSLKKLAKDLNIPVVCVAQLSRKVEERAGGLIFLSDLKESGSIEEDSDVVLALSRKDVKDPYDQPGAATLSILKNRHGRTGDIKLTFQKELSRFITIKEDVQW